MSLEGSYRKSFYLALWLHLILAGLLLNESTQQPQPVMALNAERQPLAITEQPPQAVQAVSVDAQELDDTLTRLKEERAAKRQEEINRQNALSRQAEQARQARINEQKRIKQLKEEADQIAISRKKAIEKEKKRLKELAEENALEEKRLLALKNEKQRLKAEQDKLKKQQEEQRRIAEIKARQAEEKAKAEQIAKAAKQAEQLAKAAKQKELADRARAAQEAQNQARIAGEVNKYKALIVNAISRQWILPENSDHRLSSQFRIRLAPDGMVLEVSLIRSSGDAILDRSAQTAIYKASPLPVPTDSEAFNLFRDISLTVRPEQIRG